MTSKKFSEKLKMRLIKCYNIKKMKNKILTNLFTK